MSAAARALAAAKAANVQLWRDGDRIAMRAMTPPAADIIEALRRHRLAVLELLDLERCEACHGPATAEHPLVECAFAGHVSRLHRACLATFLESAAAAPDQYAPRNHVCDLCG